MNNNIEEINELIWEIRFEVQQFGTYLEKIYESEELSEVDDWDINGSIRHVRRIQRVGFNKIKKVLIEEQDRRKSSGKWNSRNS